MKEKHVHELRELGVRKVMGSIPVGTQIFFWSHARIMLINSPFTFHYRAQNSPSLFMHLSLTLIITITISSSVIGLINLETCNRTVQLGSWL